MCLRGSLLNCEEFYGIYKSSGRVQGGEHAKLLAESNLRFAVHSCPLPYGARPCERKERLDTLRFSLLRQIYKLFSLLFHRCGAKRKLRPTHAYMSVITVKNQSHSRL